MSKAWRETHIIAQNQEIPSACKVMLTLLWDCNGLIHNHCQDHGKMVSSAWYCAMLEEKLKPTLYSKHRGMLMNGVVLYNDSS
jgi:hypothetical protein